MKKIKLMISILFAVMVMSLAAAPVMAATVPSNYTGWITENGKKYYYKNGEKLKGSRKIGRYFYCFKGPDYAMATGIVKVGSKQYCYSTTTGERLANKYGYRVGNYYYRVGSNGLVLKKLSYAEGMAGARIDTFKNCNNNAKRLRAAFDWSRKIRYSPSLPSVPSGSTKLTTYAVHGFRTGKGDCAVQAATFCMMAKAMGYNAKMVEGYVPQSNGKFGEHAWVEIIIGGKKRVFDPNMAATYYGKIPNAGYNFVYGQKNTYKYYDKNKILITA